MAATIHGIDVEEAVLDLDGGARLFQLWEEFLTDNLQKFSNPDWIEYEHGGNIHYCFQNAFETLAVEDIMISEGWLNALEIVADVAPFYADEVQQYADRVRAHHAKASA